MHVRVNNTDGKALSCLLDTGASLSIIDEGLLRRLGGASHGDSMPVHGLGNTSTKGWTTITIFVDAIDPHGRRVKLEFEHDFHVLPDFAPGLCLGEDFIATQDITISPVRGRGRISRYTFDVTERVDAPFAADAELCTVGRVVIPAGMQQWVPVRASALVPGVDYFIAPRLSVTQDETGQLAGPCGVMTHRSIGHVLLGNHGVAPVTLEASTIVADASAARVGDVSSALGRSFTLTAAHPLSATVDIDAHPPAEPDPDIGMPLDVFEGVEQPGSTLAQEAATVMVDDVFRVGVDASGQPPQPVVDVLRRHTAAFALDGRPGRVEGNEMPINIAPEAVLRSEPPRRASPEKRAAMDSAIDQLLDWDVIEPSTSPLSFPVLMVRQYGKWRFCVDYRKLNEATIPDRYPLPTIDAIFNTLSGKTIFSCLDAIRGYHQLGVRKEDRWKTAFVCHRGLFQYKMVPFGLRNAPAVFQRLMDKILGSLRWSQAVVYIDDSVVATHTLEEHVDALDTLLRSATAIGLRFSPTKCTFAVPSLVLLGRKVSGMGVAIWSDRAQAVRDLKRPTTLQELYHVLGLFGYYRGFVPRFAEIAAPLTRLLKGWRYECDDDHSRLVSSDGKTAVASRVPIEWGDAQQTSFDRLRVAIAHPPVLAHPDPARPYVLYTDASKDAMAAVLHQVHRLTVDSPVEGSAVDARVHHLRVDHLPTRVARERWSAWLEDDRHFGPILSRARAGEDDDWAWDGGMLVRRSDDRIALPTQAVPTLLKALHDDQGHFGFSKTYMGLSQHFWRPHLSTLVRAWVKHCPVCQRTKRVPKTGALDIAADPTLPFERISVDLIYGFPTSSAGNNAAVVILDLFSRMVLLQPCTKEITAEGLAAVLSDRVLRLGWRPRRLITDSEPRTSGHVMATLAASLGAELTPATPYHQQANAVERAVQTIQTVIQTMCLDTKAHWDRRVLPAVEVALNATPSVVTGQRPFDLVFISHPNVVHAVFDSAEHLGVSSFSERLSAASARLEEARGHIIAARREQKRRYDSRRAALPAPLPGDEAFIRLRDRPVPGTAKDKLDARKLGPFPVQEVLSPHRIRLRLPDSLEIDPVFSVEQLDFLPRDPDPFADVRTSARLSVPPSGAADPPPDAVSADDLDAGDPGVDSAPAALDPRARVDSAPTALAPRARAPPRALRDFQIGVLSTRCAVDEEEVLRGPIHRPRRLVLDGEERVYAERPVAYLSRLTSPAERRLVAAELELCCLAWAFHKLAHLLEGAPLTVVTDHAPMERMLRSTGNVTYGPTITRCRALLMPHLNNIRFVHRAGSSHTNADALSRLPIDPGRSTFAGGDVTAPGT